MTPTGLKVVEVVSRRDFDRPCPEFPIDEESISHDGNVSLGERKADSFPDQVAVPGVFRMHRHGGVAQHSLRSRRRDDQAGGGVIGQRVGDMVELPLVVLVFDLDVRQRRQAAGAPVNQALPPVDQSFFVQADKDLAHRFR